MRLSGLTCLCWLCFCVPPATAVEPASAPLPAATATKAMTLPEGFQVTLFAGEPDIVQPIAMTFDDRGRMWVVECLSYPNWTHDGSGGDRVTILEDTNGDGRHDKRTVFLDNGVNLTGIEWEPGGVWLTSLPNLLFIPDADRDDRPDGPPQVRLEGWDDTPQHNAVNGLVWGPDGWLYGCNGILSNSRVGSPETPEAVRTPIDCGVWRYHPTRKIFDAVAHGTTNPWGLDFDEYGQAFITNCVIKHLFHVIPGAHYERMFGQDVNPYAYTLLPSCADHIHWGGGHWTTSRSATGSHDDAGGGHAHSGCAIYLSDYFPAEYRNNVFMSNIHGNRLNRDQLERSGATYQAHHAPDFLFANDSWFRGIAVKCGPGGELYFTDWSDTGECHDHVDIERTNGRIYRVTYGTAPAAPVDLSQFSHQQLVDRQFDRNDWVVRQSRRILQARASDPDVAAELRGLLTQLQPQDDYQAVRKIWALHACGEKVRAAKSASEWERLWCIQLAADAAQPWSEEERQAIAAELPDSTPLIRRALASTCQQRIRSGHADDVLDVLPQLLSRSEDADDPVLVALNWYALEPLVASHTDVVLGWLPNIRMPDVRTYVARRTVTLENGLERLVAQWSTPAADADDWRVDSLRGILDAYAGVKRLPMPGNWPATYQRLQQADDVRVRQLAQQLGSVFGDPQVIAQYRETLANSDATVAQRMQALEILLARRTADLSPALQPLLDEPELRTAAIRGLVAIGGEDVPQQLLSRYSQATDEQRREIIQGLTTRPAFAHHLLNAIENGDVPRQDVSALVIRQLQAIGDETLSARLAAVWGNVRAVSESKRELVAKYRAELSTEALAGADLKQGKLVFNKTCGNCHKLFGEGASIGPEITGSQRANLDYLLDNIIDPSAIVPGDYRVVMFVLDDGRILQGNVLEENDLHLVLQTSTEKVVIPLDAIETRKTSNVSMMPEGILDGLTAEQRRVLIAYLQSPHGVEEQPEPTAAWHLKDRVWDSDVIYGESLTLLQQDEGEPLVGRLAFPVEEILSVQLANRSQTVDVSQGVTVDKARGRLQFPAGADLPRITAAEMFPPLDSPHSYKHRAGHPDQAMLYGPGVWFHNHQLEVTYRRQPTPWQGTVPRLAAEQLPRTLARLNNGQPLTLAVSGDSISTGADASGVNDVAPRQPGYPDLLAASLQAQFTGPITLKNRAVGGWSIANGLADLDTLLSEKPHLIVMAYGMNDVSRRDPQWFGEQAQQFVARVQAFDPTIEIILVSSMLGHNEWIHTPREMFDQYRDQLAALVGPGVALADVTSVWTELLRNKHDLDLTGNGLNHPNDFGHRLYAQVILALLTQ